MQISETGKLKAFKNLYKENREELKKTYKSDAIFLTSEQRRLNAMREMIYKLGKQGLNQKRISEVMKIEASLISYHQKIIRRTIRELKQ